MNKKLVFSFHVRSMCFSLFRCWFFSEFWCSSKRRLECVAHSRICALFSPGYICMNASDLLTVPTSSSFHERRRTEIVWLMIVLVLLSVNWLHSICMILSQPDVLCILFVVCSPRRLKQVSLLLPCLHEKQHHWSENSTSLQKTEKAQFSAMSFDQTKN